MPAKKLRRGRRVYGVEDEAGNTLMEPSTTPKDAARAAAARLAAGRGESVYVFEVGKDSDGTHIVVNREEIRPPAEPPKSRAQIKREIDEVLAKKPGGVLGGGAKSSGDGEIARARETSERRIAALIANGEDVRNTPAWRDARAESRMIDLMTRAGADPVVPFRRRIGIDRSKHTRVDIRWYAIPNQNKASGGFLPMIEEDGKVRSDTCSVRGYDKAEAEAMAEEKAHKAASRFVGDWNVVVKKGRPTRQ
jgi:hypothetical protein